MVRYKRYRRRYKKSTNVVRMKFQSFMDISTTSDSMQIITISAGGPELLKRLAPQFAAYKYYKIGNIACKLVPASTLPCDPSGLSLETAEPGVDPRDQLTPGMMRITNGEDIFEDITGLTDDVQHAIYNNMLLDPRWFKWMLQSGVKRHATPRYWTIGQLHQDKWPGSTLNVPHFTANPVTGESPVVDGTDRYEFYSLGSGSDPVAGNAAIVRLSDTSSPYGLFQTGHRGVLGWLPTDGMDRGQAFLTSPPEVEVMKIILPKAYKTRYYYRMFITETVYFREPIVNFGIEDPNGLMYRPLDVFHRPSVPAQDLPTSAQHFVNWPDGATGGNYGDD